MRLFRVFLAKRFQAELNNITAVIAEGAGSNVARRWNARLIEQARSLDRMPYRGAVAEWAGFQRLVVGPYLIVYRIVEPDRVEVLRVLDGRQDLSVIFPAIEAV